MLWNDSERPFVTIYHNIKVTRLIPSWGPFINVCSSTVGCGNLTLHRITLHYFENIFKTIIAKL